MADLYGLLNQLGVTANYAGFFHMACAVSLCIEQPDRLLQVTKRLYPDVAKQYGTNWKAVEHTDGMLCHLAGEPPPAGGAGPQASGAEAPKRADAGDFGLSVGARPPAAPAVLIKTAADVPNKRKTAWPGWPGGLFCAVIQCFAHLPQPGQLRQPESHPDERIEKRV